MPKNPWKWLLVITLLLVIVAGSACEAVKPGQEEAAEELLDEMFPTYTKEPTDTPEPTPTPTPEPTPEPKVSLSDTYGDPKFAVVDQVIRSLNIGVSHQDQVVKNMNTDEKGGKIHSEGKDATPGEFDGTIDIHAFGGFPYQAPPGWGDPPPFDLLSCQQPIGQGNWLPVCPQDAGPFQEKRFYIIFMVFEKPIPWEGEDFNRIYAFTADSDNEPDNNWEAYPLFPYDFYIGTDAWRELHYDHMNGTWTLSLKGPATEGMVTNARALISGNTITLIIPFRELPVENFGYRVSSFMYGENFLPENSGGDVSGDNPTQPLTIFENDPILIADPSFVGAELDDDYVVCDTGKCRCAERTVEAQKVMVWCLNANCASVGCECHLFNRELDDPANDPDSWYHVAGPMKKMQKDMDYEYDCFCVEED